MHDTDEEKPSKNTKKRVNAKEIEEKENFYISPKMFKEELWQFYKYAELVDKVDEVYFSEENVALREAAEKLDRLDHSPEAEELRTKMAELDALYYSDEAKENRRMRRRWYNQCRTFLCEARKGIVQQSAIFWLHLERRDDCRCIA